MINFSMDIINTFKIRLWAWAKVPLLNWIKPQIIELSDKRVEIAIPLLKRNQNHLNSMYFGVLACGADLAGGLLAFKKSNDLNQPISLVFKNFSAEFLRRPEAVTHFICNDGKLIQNLVKRAIKSGKREETLVKVLAICPKYSEDQPVAKFSLTLSIKKSPKKPVTNWIEDLFKKLTQE